MATPRPINATHTLLKSALFVAKMPGPPGTFQLGGPTPRLSAAATAKVAVWCAERARSEASPEDAADLDTAIAEARTLIDHPDRARDHVGAIADFHSLRCDPRSVGRLAIDSAIRVTRKPGSIGRPTRQAVLTTIRLARDAAWSSGRSEAVMRRFVEDLDQTLMRIELESILARRLREVPTIARVLWRAAGPILESSTHFVAALNPTGYGLLAKLGTATSGTRERGTRSSRPSPTC